MCLISYRLLTFSQWIHSLAEVNWLCGAHPEAQELLALADRGLAPANAEPQGGVRGNGCGDVSHYEGTAHQVPAERGQADSTRAQRGSGKPSLVGGRI